MPLIQNYKDIDKLRPLSRAEAHLIDACRSGIPCMVGTGHLHPYHATGGDLGLRADLLRYLILGGCVDNPVTGFGVEVHGARITGKLDLGFAQGHGATRLINCHFDQPVRAFQARLGSLNLTGSVLPELDAQGAEIAGSLLLDRARFNGQVTLYNARIGRQLAAAGAHFHAVGQSAIDAHAAKIEGSLVFKEVTATSDLNFFGAEVGHQAIFTGATLQAGMKRALNAQDLTVRDDICLDKVHAIGEINLAGAQIGGRLLLTGSTFSTQSTYALRMVRMCLSEGLVWQRVKLKNGRVSLTAAHAGEIVHDFASDLETWPEGDHFALDGFTYDRVTGPSISPSAYIKWLEKGTITRDNFFPQPFTQLARVLRERGHDRDARIILAHRDMLIRRNIRARLRIEPDGTWETAFSSLGRDLSNLRRLFFDLLLRRTVGYGYRPFRSMWMLGTLVLVAVVLAHMTWEEGSFVPASLSAQNSESFRALADHPNPAAAWSQRPLDSEGARTGHVEGQDWTRFNAAAYAADLVIPVIDLGQTSAWQPSAERGPWGRTLWGASFFLAIAGWIVTALGAAAITGLIRRD